MDPRQPAQLEETHIDSHGSASASASASASQLAAGHEQGGNGHERPGALQHPSGHRAGPPPCWPGEWTTDAWHAAHWGCEGPPLMQSQGAVFHAAPLPPQAQPLPPGGQTGRWVQPMALPVAPQAMHQVLLPLLQSRAQQLMWHQQQLHRQHCATHGEAAHGPQPQPPSRSGQRVVSRPHSAGSPAVPQTPAESRSSSSSRPNSAGSHGRDGDAVLVCKHSRFSGTSLVAAVQRQASVDRAGACSPAPPGTPTPEPSLPVPALDTCHLTCADLNGCVSLASADAYNCSNSSGVSLLLPCGGGGSGDPASNPCGAAELPVPPLAAGAAAQSGWATLTAAILHLVAARLPRAQLPRVRLVCAHWRAAVDANLTALRPAALKPRLLLERFPVLRELHLCGCPAMRNKDFLQLARGGLRLRTLSVGDDRLSPWVTNQGMGGLGQMTSLTALHLHDCANVTNKGLEALSSLQGLQQLSLHGCRKATAAGLEWLQHAAAPRLSRLSLFGCHRMGSQVCKVLWQQPLVALQLGGTKVRDEGLGYIACITTLQELALCGEQVTAGGLMHLARLPGLRRLSLEACGALRATLLPAALGRLRALRQLRVARQLDLDDACLAACLEAAPRLTALSLHDTWVSECGLWHLAAARARHLSRLSYGPMGIGCASGLAVASLLTQLEALSIHGMHCISARLLASLAQLPRLRELSLIHRAPVQTAEPAVIPPVQPLEQYAAIILARMTSLACLDLSGCPVTPQQAALLAGGLPGLRRLRLVGCGVEEAACSALERRFPLLTVQKKPQHCLDCHSGMS